MTGLASSLSGFIPQEPADKPKPTPAAAKKSRAEKPIPEKRVIGKSRDPQFQKLTVYVREETRKAVGIKLLQEGGGRELSELVEQLLNDWTASRLNV